MLHFLLEIIIMTRSTKTRLLLRDKCKVVHSDRLYRPAYTIQLLCLLYTYIEERNTVVTQTPNTEMHYLYTRLLSYTNTFTQRKKHDIKYITPDRLT